MNYRFESTLSVSGPIFGRSGEDSIGSSQDRLLMESLLEGDGAAFTSLFERHNERIFLYCARMLGDRDLGEDVAQDVWVRLIRIARRKKKRAIRHPLPFIFRIARNLCLNALRDGRRVERKEHRELESIHEGSLRERSHGRGSNREDLLVIALGQIPLKYREVLVLNAWSGYDFGEIGQMLEISREAAWKRASRGRALLKEMIEQEEKRS